MADTKQILCTVVMVINIIVGAFVVLVGVNNVFYFFNDALKLDILDALSWLFYGLCIIALGLILICFELKFKRDMITKEMGFFSHYLGKGSYVFFISILSYRRASWMWGGENASWGSFLGLLSAILSWILYGCMDHK